MPPTIDYYFSLVSPWAYIGYAPFMEIVKRHGVSVNHKPVSLGRVFDQTGGLPLPKRHPARQSYRMLELQRWRARRGLAFNLHPKFWPFDVALADRAVIALIQTGQDPEGFLRRAHAGVWEGEMNLADEAVLAGLLGEGGAAAAPLLKLARGDSTEVVYILNYENALAANVFGSPSYVVDGEVFWGQDRLDLLDDMLASRRSAYSPQA